MLCARGFESQFCNQLPVSLLQDLLLPLQWFITYRFAYGKKIMEKGLCLWFFFFASSPTFSEMPADYFFPLWQSSYYVLCTFKCVKHRVWLAGPWDSRQKRGRLCFLSHGDVAFGCPLPLDWLAERVSKQPHPVSQFLYVFCTQRAKRTFSPCTGKCQERKTYKTSAWGSSVSFAAEPACSRQAGWTLAFGTAKQRK